MGKLTNSVSGVLNAFQFLFIPYYAPEGVPNSPSTPPPPSNNLQIYPPFFSFNPPLSRKSEEGEKSKKMGEKWHTWRESERGGRGI